MTESNFDPNSIEDAVLTKLNDDMRELDDKIAVEAYPDAGEYFLKHPHGALLVSVREGSLGQNNSAQGVYARHALTVVITIMTRGRRNTKSQKGFYGWLKFVLNSLSNLFIASEKGSLAARTWGIDDYQNGIWLGTAEFELGGVFVQPADGTAIF